MHFFLPGLPDPATRASYERIAPVHWHARAGLSSVFVQLARSWRDPGGRCLPRMRAATGHVSTALVCWSAGYGAIRELLRHPADRAEIDAVVCLDAVHAGFDPDGTPSDAMLAGFTAYAQLAKIDPSKLLWIGHGDVSTTGYASTAETAAELVRLAGGTGGQFLVESYDVRDTARAEHAAALTGWGPGFAAEALRPHLGRLAAERAGAAPWRSPRLSLGERCVLWARAQIALGDLEIWGRNAGSRIRAYFAGATRRNPATGGEQPVGIDHGDWCVVGLTAAERECLLPGERPVLQLRVAGWEIEDDAMRDGSWVPAADIQAGKYTPRVGDAGTMMRPRGSNPHATRTRHAFRFATAVNDDGSYTSVDGNSGHDGRRWATNERSIHDPDFRGVRPYPQPAAEALPDVWAESVLASERVMRGEFGLDYALKAIQSDDV